MRHLGALAQLGAFRMRVRVDSCYTDRWGDPGCWYPMAANALNDLARTMAQMAYNEVTQLLSQGIDAHMRPEILWSGLEGWRIHPGLRTPFASPLTMEWVLSAVVPMTFRALAAMDTIGTGIQAGVYTVMPGNWPVTYTPWHLRVAERVAFECAFGSLLPLVLETARKLVRR